MAQNKSAEFEEAISTLCKKTVWKWNKAIQFKNLEKWNSVTFL